MMLISGSKSVKFAQKFRIFLEFLTSEGTLSESNRGGDEVYSATFGNEEKTN